VYSRLVYACAARDVEHVLVDGSLVVKNGEHQRLDRDAVLGRARSEAKKLTARAKI
jgi:cytosine/adenosine deaminase-related metal-dependent hydrolase